MNYYRPKRRQARTRRGRFTRNTPENTLGLHIELCEKCWGLIPWDIGDERPTKCHHCGAPLEGRKR